MYTKYFSLFFLSLFILTPTFAQINSETQQRADITSETLQIIEVTQADLDLSTQDVIPGSPWYGFKEFGRGFSLFFTVNPVKKAEKLSKFSDERILEIRQLIAQGADQSVIDKAIEEYKKEMEQIKSRVEDIALRKDENLQERFQQFLEKFTDHQIRHQEIFVRIIDQAPQSAKERLQEVKQEHAKRFFDTLKRIDGKQELILKGVQRQLENGDENSDLRYMHRMRVLQKMGRESEDADIQSQLGPAQAELFQKLEEKLNQNSNKERRLQRFIDQTSEDQVDAIDFVAGLRRASSMRHRVMFDQIQADELDQLEQDILQNHPRLQKMLEDESKAQYIQQLPLRLEVKERARIMSDSMMQGNIMKNEALREMPLRPQMLSGQVESISPSN